MKKLVMLMGVAIMLVGCDPYNTERFLVSVANRTENTLEVYFDGLPSTELVEAGTPKQFEVHALVGCGSITSTCNEQSTVRVFARDLVTEKLSREKKVTVNKKSVASVVFEPRDFN
jgi:uncharacterized protein YcfL